MMGAVDDATARTGHGRFRAKAVERDLLTSQPLLGLAATVVAWSLVLLGLVRLPWLIPASSPRFPAWLDWILAGLVALAGVFWAFSLHGAVDPDWIPQGQDSWDYLNNTLGYLEPGYRGGSDFYAPLYPAVSALLAALFPIPPHECALGVTVVATGLLPMACYLFVREMAPRVVALAAAFLVPSQASVVEFVASPSAYPLTTLLVVLSLTTVIRFVWADGNRWVHGLYCGLSLALLATSSWSTLPLLLSALVAIVLVTASRAHRMRWRTFAVGGAVFVPLLCAWVLIGHTPIEPAPLETAIHMSVEDSYRLFVETAQQSPPKGRVQPPVAAGWSLEPDERVQDCGWWRPGRWDSFGHLHQVLAYLVLPKRYPAYEEQFRANSRDLTERFVKARTGIELNVLLVLTALAFLGAGYRRKGPRLFAVAITVLLGLAWLVAPVFGVMSTVPWPRYAHTFLCCAPSLAIACCALPFRLSHRRNSLWAELAWLPLIFVVVWLAYGPSAPAFWERAERSEDLVRRDHSFSSVRQVVTLARQLEAGDQVVDIAVSGSHATLAIYRGAASAELVELMGGADGGRVQPVVGGWSSGRRYLVLECAWRPLFDAPRETRVLIEALAGSSRFTPLDSCVYEDLQPESELLIETTWP